MESKQEMCFNSRMLLHDNKRLRLIIIKINEDHISVSRCKSQDISRPVIGHPQSLYDNNGRHKCYERETTIEFSVLTTTIVMVHSHQVSCAIIIPLMGMPVVILLPYLTCSTPLCMPPARYILIVCILLILIPSFALLNESD